MCHGEVSGVLWAGEWNAMAEGTQEKVWACRKSKVPLLGSARGGEADCHKNIFLYTHADSWRTGLWVARHLLCGLWGAYCIS